MRLVFMGTPDFSIPSLKKLIQSRHQIVGVVTAFDKPKGRGRKLAESPVKRFALEHNLKVLTPEKLKNEDFIKALKELSPDLIVVVAFRILPEVVFSLPRLGTINLHASLLPRYRGAAPINWALMNGETKTGLTTFYIRKKVDTGDMILRRETEIYPEENFGELHDRMAQQGADVLLETVDLIERGEVKTLKQDDTQATPAPKITPEHCRIDWSRKATQIKNQIRGLAPSPGAFTFFRGKILKIYRAHIIGDVSFTGDLGQVTESDEKESLWVKTGSGILSLLEVQPEGKRRMSIEEFVRGYRVQPEEKLG
ncbi:MAG: methionyl-tRNA formyltransferase [candidate division Zixibacteria bacterium SM23_73_3]|nr:MAG: methionyl-tRNA formyltransferase [candidate division Zixibacteria bacterium SM23_73_3]